jgi:hypothetical protein
MPWLDADLAQSRTLDSGESPSCFFMLFHEKASQSYFFPVTNIFFKVFSVLLPFALFQWAWLRPGAR